MLRTIIHPDLLFCLRKRNYSLQIVLRRRYRTKKCLSIYSILHIVSLVVPNDRLSLVLVIDLLDLLGAQLDFTSLDQIVQLVQTGSPDNRSGDEWFTQTPSESYLGHTDVPLLGNSLHFADNGFGGFRNGETARLGSLGPGIFAVWPSQVWMSAVFFTSKQPTYVHRRGATRGYSPLRNAGE